MLSIPSFVWKWQGEGYVCLSSSDPATKKSWDDRFFPWPGDREPMLEYIQESQEQGRDVYWAVAVYDNDHGRREENVSRLKVLWADLDHEKGCLPPGIIHPRPSMLWETSPQNHHAVWILDDYLDVRTFKQLNKDLTYRLGADHGTWNVSRVLRIPGSINYKRQGAEGRIIYAKKVIHSINSFIHTVQGEEDTYNSKHSGINRDDSIGIQDLLYPYRKKITAKAWELINTPPGEATQDKDRSARLWQLQRLLEEARVPRDIIREALERTVWNKFAGRYDEEIRLDAQVAKTEEEIIIDTPAKQWMSYTELMGRRITRPQWLIEGWWQRASHGIVAGEPKTYKSIISTDAAVAVASGKPFLGQYRVVSPGPVLIVQEENDAYTVQDRLRKITHSRGVLKGGAKVKGKSLELVRPPTLPIYMLNNQQFSLTDDEDKLMLEERIRDIKPALVILDPLYLMLGDIDENSAKDLRPVFSWLLYLSNTYSTAIMVLHHFKKAFSQRGGQRMLGSATIHAWVESALYTRLKGDDTVEIEREFRSFAKPGRTKLVFEMGKHGQLAYDVRVAEEEEIVAKVRGMIKSQVQCTIEEVVALAESKRKALYILKHLEKEGEVEHVKGERGSGKRDHWRWIGE